MAKNISVLLFGRSSTRLNKLEDIFLDYPSIDASRKLMSDKSRDPLTELPANPDAIVLDLDDNWDADLTYFSNSSAGVQRIPLIVIGRPDEPDMMRRAMQAGARDFFVSPILEEELIESVAKVGSETQQAQRTNQGQITAILNGKGGSGASFLASSFATLLGARKKGANQSCVVVDLDLQLGDIPVYFDLSANDNLMVALETGENLDNIALEGFLQQYAEGVHVLASQSEEIRMPNSVDGASVQHLLSTLAQYNDHVFVNLPRSLDTATIAAIETADLMLLITQQSVPHVRDTKYLHGLIRSLGISNNDIKIIINRFEKKGEIRLADMREAFAGVELLQVPEDLKRVSFAVNNGIPLPVKWPKASITLAMQKVVDAISLKNQSEKPVSRSFFGR